MSPKKIKNKKRNHSSLFPSFGANFDSVTSPFPERPAFCPQIISPDSKGGQLALIDTPAQAAQCKAALGENCLPNTLTGTPAPNRVDAAVLTAFGKLDKEGISSARAAASKCGEYTLSNVWPISCVVGYSQLDAHVKYAQYSHELIELTKSSMTQLLILHNLVRKSHLYMATDGLYD